MKFYEADEHCGKGAYLKEKATGLARNEGMAHISFLLTARFQPSLGVGGGDRKQTHTKWMPKNTELKQKNPPGALNYC